MPLAGLWLLLLLLSLSPSPQAATLTAAVDRKQLALDETLELQVRYNRRLASGTPDFSRLEANFDILRRSQTSEVRVINGELDAWLQWSLTLAPRRIGTLTIPELVLDGASSAALQVEVLPSGQDGSLAQRDYQLVLLTDRQRVHVGEPVRVTLRLSTAISLSNLQAPPFEVAGARVVELEDERYEKIIDGQRFGVYEKNYLLFPLSAGPLEIPAQRYSAEKSSTRSRFGFTRAQPVQLRSTPLRLEVTPVPAQFPPERWLTASSLQLTEEWRPEPDSVRVGEVLTRTLTLQATDTDSRQLPALNLPEHPGLKRYPETPAITETVNTQGLAVEWSQSVGLVPTRPGPVTLPEIRLRWWNHRKQREEEAVLPARTLQVLPAAGSPGGSAQLTQPAASVSQAPADRKAQIDYRLAFWLSNLGWLLLVGVLAVRWQLSRRERRASDRSRNPLQTLPTTAGSLAELRRLAARQRPHDFRRRLLSWAEAHWPDAPPRSLADIGTRLENRELQQQLAELDRSLFAADPGITPSLEQLLQVLQDCLADPGAGAAASESPLESLYQGPIVTVQGATGSRKKNGAKPKMP